MPPLPTLGVSGKVQLPMIEKCTMGFGRSVLIRSDSNCFVYPPSTSLRRIRCFYRFSRLVKSLSYVFSIGLRIPTPPSPKIWRGMEFTSRAPWRRRGNLVARTAARLYLKKEEFWKAEYCGLQEAGDRIWMDCIDIESAFPS